MTYGLDYSLMSTLQKAVARIPGYLMAMTCALAIPDKVEG